MTQVKERDRTTSESVAPSWRTSWLTAALHLVALWGLVVLQPVLSVIETNGEFFIAREVGGASLALFVVLFAFLPPALLAGLVWLARRISERAGVAVHLVFIYLLLALGGIYALKRQLTDVDGATILLGGIGLGAVAAFLYVRWRFVSSLLTLLALAPVLFVLLFVFNSTATDVIFPPKPQVPSAASLQATPSAKRTPVVMLVIDEVPITTFMDSHERIDAKHFPNMARLARTSNWFRNDAAAADYTIKAVPALLSGRRVQPGEVPLAADHPQNLFTLLAGTHRVTGSEYATEICQPSLCKPPVSPWRRMLDLPNTLSSAIPKILLPADDVVKNMNLPQLGTTWQEFHRVQYPERHVDADTASRAELAHEGDAQFARFLKLTDQAPTGGKPPLLFFHSVLPHITWKFLPSGQVFAPELRKDRISSFDSSGAWVRDPTPIELLYQRHMLQAEYADRQLGRLIAHLKAKGLWDKSVFVLVADHGTSFKAGEQRRSIDKGNVGDIAPVPFFIKRPGQHSGRVDDRQMQNIDVLPTIADALGVRIPWKVAGRSAFHLPPAGRQTLAIAGQRAGLGITVSSATIQRLRRKSLALKLKLFGAGSTGKDLFRLGPRTDLVGKPVSALRPVPAGRATATVDLPEDYRDVKPRSRYVPAMITGNVKNAPAGMRNVAIALNGRIAATASLYEGRTLYGAIVPPATLRPGRNRVEVLAISGRGTHTVLQPLGGIR